MYQAVVIGSSNGGLEALKVILPALPYNFAPTVIVVLHIGTNSIDSYINNLNTHCQLPVKVALDKEPIDPGTIYFAPPDYHLMVEANRCFSLSQDPKINYSRPSIDVLFETAAWSYANDLIGIVLTGANADGAEGLRTIANFNGYTMIQDPSTALSPIMPLAALSLTIPKRLVKLSDIASELMCITNTPMLYS